MTQFERCDPKAHNYKEVKNFDSCAVMKGAYLDRKRAYISAIDSREVTLYRCSKCLAVLKRLVIEVKEYYRENIDVDSDCLNTTELITDDRFDGHGNFIGA